MRVQRSDRPLAWLDVSPGCWALTCSGRVHPPSHAGSWGQGAGARVSPIAGPSHAGLRLGAS